MVKTTTREVEVRQTMHLENAIEAVSALTDEVMSNDSDTDGEGTGKYREAAHKQLKDALTEAIVTVLPREEKWLLIMWASNKKLIDVCQEKVSREVNPEPKTKTTDDLWEELI